MTSIRSQSFRTQQAATYQSYEECHWTVVTLSGKNIRFTINSMDIKNSTNNTGQSDKCTGDFLEVSLNLVSLIFHRNTNNKIITLYPNAYVIDL